MEPLIVTAHLRNGFSAAEPWSPALDGILGYWLLREKLGPDEFFVQAARPDLREPLPRLPLEVQESGYGEWWYAASIPLYEAQREFIQYYHRRFDAHLAERYMVPTKGRVNTKAGPYKAFRLYERVRLTDRVQWHVVGDAGEIRRLLARCTNIGSKASQGRGRVASWEVSAGGDSEKARYLRPLPAEFAEAMGIRGFRIRWGLRPPVRDTVTDAVIPEVEPW